MPSDGHRASKALWGAGKGDVGNQSAVVQAFTEFDDDGRTKPSSYYDRIVDMMEEPVRFTVLLRPHTDQLVDRYSERKEAGIRADAAASLASIT